MNPTVCVSAKTLAADMVRKTASSAGVSIVCEKPSNDDGFGRCLLYVSGSEDLEIPSFHFGYELIYTPLLFSMNIVNMSTSLQVSGICVTSPGLL